MIEFLEKEKIIEKVQADELFVTAQLQRLKDKFPLIGDVRGIGLLWGIELVTDRVTKTKAIQAAEKIMYACLEAGLSFKVSQGNVLQLCPPLIITREELTAAIAIIEKAIEKVVAEMN